MRCYDMRMLVGLKSVGWRVVNYVRGELNQVTNCCRGTFHYMGKSLLTWSNIRKLPKLSYWGRLNRYELSEVMTVDVDTSRANMLTTGKEV